MNNRKIIHVDMDAFYASVEQRDHPELKGKPIAVGGGSSRSVVCAASYEARKFGVRSAMSGIKARKLCPELIFVEPRFARYKEVSTAIHRIFQSYTDIIEPLSLDEAFLDVTNNKKGIILGKDIALEIKERIKSELHLTASAGVSYNKFLAKIASDYRKPDGLCVIHPSIASKFIEKLKIEDFWGVGKVTAQHMHEIGIFTGKDLLGYRREELIRLFGKAGAIYYDFARGIDLRPVETNWQRKSVGCEYTLQEDSSDFSVISTTLLDLAQDLERRAWRNNFIGKCLTLKIKYHDFSVLSRSYTPTIPPFQARNYYQLALYLYRQLKPEEQAKPIRLLGISISQVLPNFDGHLWYQPELFDFEDTIISSLPKNCSTDFPQLNE